MPDDFKFARVSWGTNSRGCHPGLYLDKLVGHAPVTTERQGKLLDAVLQRMGTGQGEFQAHAKRRKAVLGALGATSWTRTTAAPMSLHLSRANAFENAGICLHRTYGFAYIPGSGLKGMARAWAETWWLPQQQDKVSAWRWIEDVFGWGDTKQRREQINDDGHPAGKRTRTIREDDRERQVVDTDGRGAIVFHDAWPTAWPVIEKDILACHHNDYYTAKEGQVPAPGDWESPNLVNFLAVKSGTEFQFAIGKSHTGVRDDLLTLAKTFLDGALTDLGAGAKTNAGYGVFKPLEGQDRTVPNTRKRIEVELELVTPAFLAGAAQQAQDCDLRGATLRGQLRWWWRTMHAAHLRPKELRMLESLIWGSSAQGGAVGVRVSANPRNWPPTQPEFKLLKERPEGPPRLVFQTEFARRHGFDTNAGDTPGLSYLCYGLHEYSSREKMETRRFFRSSGSRWAVALFARRVELGDAKISDEAVLCQARLALELLVYFGGVGSRSRNGLGSLQPTSQVANNLITRAISESSLLRQSLKLSQGAGLGGSMHRSDTPCLEELQTRSICLNTWDEWHALHLVGSAVQRFAAKRKHCSTKLMLGLPRQIHGPYHKPIAGRQTPNSHQPPEPLLSIKMRSKVDRHPAPIFWTFEKAENGLCARLTWMPDNWLRPRGKEEEIDRHISFLEEFSNEVFGTLRSIAPQHAPVNPNPPRAYDPPPVDPLTILRRRYDIRTLRPGQGGKPSELLAVLKNTTADSEALIEYCGELWRQLELSDKRSRKRKTEANSEWAELIEFIDSHRRRQ